MQATIQDQSSSRFSQCDLPPLTEWQRKRVDEGRKAAERGDFVSPDEMQKFFLMWRQKCSKK
jgi:hypothetical protein